MKPQPTPAEFLAEGLRFYMSRTKPDSIYATPLFRGRLRSYHTKFGRDVNVELLPNLVFRVRDPKTGEILAQGKPGQLDLFDEKTAGHLEMVWSSWLELRSRFELFETIASGEQPSRDRTEALPAALCAADESPALEALLKSARQAVLAPEPKIFFHDGRPYWIRVSIGVARMEVFDAPSMEQPVVTGSIGPIDTFEYSPPL